MRGTFRNEWESGYGYNFFLIISRYPVCMNNCVCMYVGVLRSYCLRLYISLKVLSICEIHPPLQKTQKLQVHVPLFAQI